MKTKVSICIPTYNRATLLHHTLESVFAQTYKDFEVVIVDDGSTDSTGKMLKESGYPIRYYWQENTGDAASRNRLVELARGQFIVFVDSDDLLMPDAIARMMQVVQTTSDDVIVYGPYLRIDAEGNVIGKCKRRLHSGCITKHLFNDIFVHTCGSMFPKKLLERSGGFDESLSVCSDYQLWLQMSLNYRFIALTEPTFKRRRHSGNISQRSFETRLVELQVLENFYYEGRGKDVIPRNLAMKRLSCEGYRAGRSALREGLLEDAIKLLTQACKRRLGLKPLIWLTMVRLKSLLKSTNQSIYNLPE